MMRNLLLAAAGALCAVSTLGAAQAPRSSRCAYNFTAPNHPLSSEKRPSGTYNILAGGGVTATCKSKGLVVTSDSLEYYGDEARTVLIGHATYNDPRLHLTSDQLTYFENDERILATQNVRARMTTGSTIVGPQLELLRATPRVRPVQLATAIGRPTITLVQKDSQGRAQPPVNVTGNTVWMIGDSIVSAQGNVVVVRPQLTATGDSIYGDATTGLLRIMRSPKIVGTKGRPFTLVGETIDLLTRKRKLDQVLSKSNAVAQSEDLTLKSDTIDMRVTDDLLQRAIVWGKSRAHASSPTQTVTADSIDVLLPGQRVREMHAIRGAVAEEVPDTTHFVTTEKDRLSGDTIIAHFDSIPASDTTSKPRMERLIAKGNASSLQNMAPNDTSVCVARIVYAKGRLIDVRFRAGAIDSVHVLDEDLARGVQLEPKPDSANKCSVLRPHRAIPVTTVAPAKPASPGQPATTPVPAPAVALPSTKRP